MIILQGTAATINIMMILQGTATAAATTNTVIVLL